MADMSVRPGRLIDVSDFVEVQRRAWRSLPDDLWAVPDVESLDADAMMRSWERAVLLPPTSRHRLLIALEGETVVGGAALTPADDPDLPDGVVAAESDQERADELALLVVDPDHRRRGHGSRLMAAAADLVRTGGVPTLVTWVPASDDDARAWLVGAGWAADGAHRTVELDGRIVRELRFATDVRPDPA